MVYSPGNARPLTVSQTQHWVWQEHHIYVHLRIVKLILTRPLHGKLLLIAVRCRIWGAVYDEIVLATSTLLGRKRSPSRRSFLRNPVKCKDCEIVFNEVRLGLWPLHGRLLLTQRHRRACRLVIDEGQFGYCDLFGARALSLAQDLPLPSCTLYYVKF